MNVSATNRPYGTVPWRRETVALTRLSVPIVLTNLGQIAIQTTDVVMIGWLGPAPLAASVLGVTLYFILFMFSVGIMMATAPMIAQDLGRVSYAMREPRRTVRQGFWAAALLGLPASLVFWQIDPILRLLGQDPALIVGAEEYMHAAMWGFVPALLFIGLRNFISALERPRAGMVVMTIGIAVNAAADYGLIFGKFGLPELGLRGAGIATSLTNGFLFFALLGFILIDRRFRRYRLLGRLWRPDWRRLREIVRIGLPIGVTLVFEVGLFAGAAFLMGLIGTAELAAHQIALQCAAVSFMVPLGLAQAATVRVGLAVGRRDPAGIRAAGFAALGLGTVFMSGAALVMWTLPEQLAGLFLDGNDPANVEVIALAVTFLAVAGAFQVVDGAQAIGAGALRGLKDTRWPMVFAGLGYWVFGFGGAVLLGFYYEMEGIGIWIGLAGGLAVAAVLMVARFTVLQRSTGWRRPEVGGTAAAPEAGI